MKKFVIIATLTGLACGIGLRKLQAPGGEAENDTQVGKSTRSRMAPQGEVDSLVSLSWDLRGDLGSEELLELPYGGRLMAEMSLWSAKAEPDELIAHWERLKETGEKDMNVLDHFAILWARRDPDGAFAHLQGSDEEFRILWAIARIDAGKALGLVDPSNRKSLSKVLRAIGQTDPEYAMTLLEQYPNHDAHDSSQGIADGLKDIDPALAVEFSAKQAYFDSDHFRWWVAKDPKAAFAWGLKNKALASSALSSLVPMLLEQDPEYFAQEIQDIPTGKLKLDMLKAQAKHLAQSDPQKALAFADRQEGRSRVSLMHSVGDALVRDRPGKAHELFETFLKEELAPSARSLTYQDWVKRLIEQDPRAVLATAQELASADQESGESIEGEVVRQWMKIDDEASREWIKEQDPGPQRDRYLGSYIQTNQYRSNADYEELINLSVEISDEEQRGQSSSRIIKRWYGVDPDGLKNFMESPQASPADMEFYRNLGRKF